MRARRNRRRPRGARQAPRPPIRNRIGTVPIPWRLRPPDRAREDARAPAPDRTPAAARSGIFPERFGKRVPEVPGELVRSVGGELFELGLRAEIRDRELTVAGVPGLYRPFRRCRIELLRRNPKTSGSWRPITAVKVSTCSDPPCGGRHTHSRPVGRGVIRVSRIRSSAGSSLAPRVRTRIFLSSALPTPISIRPSLEMSYVLVGLPGCVSVRSVTDRPQPRRNCASSSCGNGRICRPPTQATPRGKGIGLSQPLDDARDRRRDRMIERVSIRGEIGGDRAFGIAAEAGPAARDVDRGRVPDG